MKWGYNYKDNDIVLNEKAEGDELTEQGVEIWTTQERGEYHSDYGYDRNFFVMEKQEQNEQIASKLDKDLEIKTGTSVKYDFLRNQRDKLNVKLIFNKDEA